MKRERKKKQRRTARRANKRYAPAHSFRGPPGMEGTALAFIVITLPAGLATDTRSNGAVCDVAALELLFFAAIRPQQTMHHFTGHDKVSSFRRWRPLQSNATPRLVRMHSSIAQSARAPLQQSIKTLDRPFDRSTDRTLPRDDVVAAMSLAFLSRNERYTDRPDTVSYRTGQRIGPPQEIVTFALTHRRPFSCPFSCPSVQQEREECEKEEEK